MSQILDAIKQADDKRKASENKRIGNPYQYLSVKSSKKNSRLIWLLLIAAIVIAAAVFLFYNPSKTYALRTSKPVESVTESSESPTETQTIDSTAEVVAQAEVTSDNSKNNNAITSESNENKAQTENTGNEAEAKELLAKDTDKTETDTNKVPNLALEIPEDSKINNVLEKTEKLLADIPKQAKRPSSNANTGSSQTKQPAAAESNTATTASVDNTTPAWKESMTISAIFNHADPSKRFVLISGAKLREGDTIPYRDLQLIKIMDNGIIVSGPDGQTFIKTY